PLLPARSSCAAMVPSLVGFRQRAPSSFPSLFPSRSDQVEIQRNQKAHNRHRSNANPYAVISPTLLLRQRVDLLHFPSLSPFVSADRHDPLFLWHPGFSWGCGPFACAQDRLCPLQRNDLLLPGRLLLALR